MNQELIQRPSIPLKPFALNDTAKELKEIALNSAALIGKVTNAESNDAAVNAQRELKRVMAMFERERKAAKEPLLEAGRMLDNLIKGESEDLDKELGRISVLITEFALQEQRRVREEQRLQQAELDRIEREKQAELKRIADEQSAREAKARTELEAAARAARDAKSLQEREAAKKLLGEAAEREREIQRQNMAAEADKKRVEETAQIKTAIEAKPIAATRSEGQIIKTDWQITVTNPYELAKFHPDCVLEIKPAIGQIKAYLNQGMTIRGINAVKVTTANVKHSTNRSMIEV